MSLRVVIAARGGPEAKSRLKRRLSPRQRAALAGAMLADMLDTLADCPAVERVYVVTPTAELARIAADAGAVVMLEPQPAGLNAAFEAARRRVAALDPLESLALLPGDLPRLTAEELAEAAAAARGGAVVVVRALSDGGTGAIVQSAGLVLPLAFGPDSFQRHCAAAEALGLVVHSPDAPGLGFDLDRPEDLDRLASSEAQGRAAVLARAFTLNAGAAA